MVPSFWTPLLVLSAFVGFCLPRPLIMGCVLWLGSQLPRVRRLVQHVYRDQRIASQEDLLLRLVLTRSCREPWVGLFVRPEVPIPDYFVTFVKPHQHVYLTTRPYPQWRAGPTAELRSLDGDVPLFQPDPRAPLRLFQERG